MKIKELKQHNDGSWTFRIDDTGTYYTNGNGEGLFFQDARTGNTRQLVGTCQFQSCCTVSGMRRKLEKFMDGFAPC